LGPAVGSYGFWDLTWIADGSLTHAWADGKWKGAIVFEEYGFRVIGDSDAFHSLARAKRRLFVWGKFWAKAYQVDDPDEAWEKFKEKLRS
jgi:hypothetical protein